MASSQLNTDVVTEIFWRLPAQSLLRFRAASKLWRDVIDSPAFRKSHTANYTNDSEDYTSILVFMHLPNPIGIWKSSIIFRDTGKSLDLPALGKFVNGLPKRAPAYSSPSFQVVGPVAGLICIHSLEPNGDIAVCNPFLDELKILPVDSLCPLAYSTNVGISYDSAGDDYKVVKLLSCISGVHVSIYSKNTNSWRKLAIGVKYSGIIDPIPSSYRNGAVVYWKWTRIGEEDTEYVILSFDMKTEVIRSLEMPEYGIYDKIYEKGGKFVLIRTKSTSLFIYEGVETYNTTLVWDHLKTVDAFGVFDCFLSSFLCRSGCVVLHEKESGLDRSIKRLILYDYHTEKFVGRMELPIACPYFKVYDYNGSFVSP